jgi:hypothetical protein
LQAPRDLAGWRRGGGTKVALRAAIALSTLSVMKRNVAAALWFLAVWTAVAGLAMVAGWPAVLGPAAGVMAGSFVWLDPTDQLWTAPAKPAIERRRVADLPRVAESTAGPAGQRETGPAEG